MLIDPTIAIVLGGAAVGFLLPVFGTAIPAMIEHALHQVTCESIATLADVLATDTHTRLVAKEWMQRHNHHHGELSYSSSY